uniref:Uncharacterized protein n=1 Tax=Candidatus Kentrum sp. FM TaxID=2126340 RepID=A0A450RZ50_9GAMM|nr:MAG: hypothetical protein BECKFM1743A_GA0114220_1001515 [Candidatus Kentron sp. FM]VFJ44590.1 MAG: hypothetical protein BECKFM1743C_GA0114222_1001315 [Candidatus Kentron sp. FM]VFK06529.1 MAG: hypothetical protein BECKFM1743B_GA0114221_100193 [Candidatus Kentron sp. FM]
MAKVSFVSFPWNKFGKVDINRARQWTLPHLKNLLIPFVHKGLFNRLLYVRWKRKITSKLLQVSAAGVQPSRLDLVRYPLWFGMSRMKR